MTNVERVGVLLVHGVGEQRRFEHLTDEARELILALNDEYGREHVSVNVNASGDAAWLAEQETWLAERRAPVVISVRAPDHQVDLFLHEAWWADLDQPLGLGQKLRFWSWGLGQWNATRYEQSGRGGTKHELRLPEFPDPASAKRRRTVRIQLFGVGVVFFLILLSSSLIQFVLRRILGKRVPGPDVIVNYVGDVKLLQDRWRRGEGALDDLNQPPRISIRRRAVETLFDVAAQGYDRWYCLAHSLGTVVAWNALMETEGTLVNYLDEGRFQTARDLGWLKAGTQPPPPGMRPPPPAWLEDRCHCLDRRRLFAGMHGLLTYGSPLDKYAHLWPALVRINKDEDVFHPDLEWINVYDPTDAVAGSLDAYAPETPGPGTAQVSNVAYPASPVLLLSHIRYLKHRTPKSCGKGSDLATTVVRWLVGEGPFSKLRPKLCEIPRERVGRRSVSRVVQWAALGALSAALVVVLWQGLIPCLGGQDCEAVKECVSGQVEPTGFLAGIQGFLSGVWEFLKCMFAPLAGYSLPLVLIAAPAVVLVAGYFLRWAETRTDTSRRRKGAEEQPCDCKPTDGAS